MSNPHDPSEGDAWYYMVKFLGHAGEVPVHTADMLGEEWQWDRDIQEYIASLPTLLAGPGARKRPLEGRRVSVLTYDYMGDIEDTFCEVCGGRDAGVARGDLASCDHCNRGYHAACLRPPPSELSRWYLAVRGLYADREGAGAGACGPCHPAGEHGHPTHRVGQRA